MTTHYVTVIGYGDQVRLKKSPANMLGESYTGSWCTCKRKSYILTFP